MVTHITSVYHMKYKRVVVVVVDDDVDDVVVVSEMVFIQ